MIVRRSKRRRNFTVVGNEIFEHGLTAEAVGILAYILSRPDDWTVIQKQLSKQFGCGRERIQRIMRELIEAGYVRRERIRDPETHQFVGVEYTVFDEVQDLDDTDVETAEIPVNAPQPENLSAALPQSENPQSENSTAIISTDRDKTLPQSPIPTISADQLGTKAATAQERVDSDFVDVRAVAFEAFEADWPWAPDDDRTAARKAFDRLDHHERSEAVAGISKFSEWMASGSGRRMQPKAYLRRSLWKNRCEPVASEQAGSVFVEHGTAAWHRCVERFRREHDGRSPSVRQNSDRNKRGWYFPPDW